MAIKRAVNPANGHYRKQRDALLKAEIDLKNQVERVAEMRRALPMGRRVKDYIFREGPNDLAVNAEHSFFDTSLSDLFLRGRDSLIVINMMFSPDETLGCPMCSMWADGYNAVAQHVGDKTNFVLVAKADIARLRDYARSRGWNTLRLLSSRDNTFNRDFGVEDGKDQRPGVSVFRRQGDAIHHFYTTEQSLMPGHHRGIDPYSPVWNLFDLLPEGREDWLPEHFYH